MRSEKPERSVNWPTRTREPPLYVHVGGRLAVLYLSLYVREMTFSGRMTSRRWVYIFKASNDAVGAQLGVGIIAYYFLYVFT